MFRPGVWDDLLLPQYVHQDDGHVFELSPDGARKSYLGRVYGRGTFSATNLVWKRGLDTERVFFSGKGPPQRLMLFLWQ